MGAGNQRVDVPPSDAGQAADGRRIESSMRPHCLQTDACAARTPGKHCKSCAVTARNKTPQMREVASRTARKHRVLAREEVQRAAHSPENIVRREASRQNTWMAKDPAGRREHAIKMAKAKVAWCPASYLPEYRRLVDRVHIRAADARKMIEQQIAQDAKREVADRLADMRAKHARDLASRY